MGADSHKGELSHKRGKFANHGPGSTRMPRVCLRAPNPLSGLECPDHAKWSRASDLPEWLRP
jgi:hypothetical protein